MISRREGLERAFNNAWYHGAKWTFIFLPLIPLVMLVTSLRRRFRPRNGVAALGVPVVVIGGLTAGGTGKTPTLIALARYLSGRGLRGLTASRVAQSCRLTIFSLVELRPQSAGVLTPSRA